VTDDLKELKRQVGRRVQRLQKKANREGSWLQETRYLGTLGVLLALPIVGGAYLGLYLDKKATHYSFVFTSAGLILGVVVGLVNVALFVRRVS